MTPKSILEIRNISDALEVTESWWKVSNTAGFSPTGLCQKFPPDCFGHDGNSFLHQVRSMSRPHSVAYRCLHSRLDISRSQQRITLLSSFEKKLPRSQSSALPLSWELPTAQNTSSPLWKSSAMSCLSRSLDMLVTEVSKPGLFFDRCLWRNHK